MKLTTNGKNKIPFMRKRMLLCMFACACIWASCGNPYVTVTDSFFIANESDSTIQIVLNQSVVWDTCATCAVGDDLTRVWYNSNTMPIKAGGKVRLHPIRKEYTGDIPDRHWNVAPVIGSSTQLIAGMDTIVWQVKNPYMFTSDSVWSIYNTEDWTSEKDSTILHSYYHTFVITTEKIERSR